jgi:hypothetical protein
MFAKHLSIEDGDAYELVTDPEWERVGEAIKEMNGKEHTIICLEGESKLHMTIGGGPDAFVIYASGDQETFFTAVDAGKSGGSLEITVGQQTNEYPAELLVGKDVVLKAAKKRANWSRTFIGPPAPKPASNRREDRTIRRCRHRSAQIKRAQPRHKFTSQNHGYPISLSISS